MSRKLSEQEYRKTASGRLKKWLDGDQDLLLGNVEMRPQKPFEEDEKTKEDRAEEKRRVLKKRRQASKSVPKTIIYLCAPTANGK